MSTPGLGPYGTWDEADRVQAERRVAPGVNQCDQRLGAELDGNERVFCSLLNGMVTPVARSHAIRVMMTATEGNRG